jgi:hypothetical protein
MHEGEIILLLVYILQFLARFASHLIYWLFEFWEKVARNTIIGNVMLFIYGWLVF